MKEPFINYYIYTKSQYFFTYNNRGGGPRFVSGRSQKHGFSVGAAAGAAATAVHARTGARNEPPGSGISPRSLVFLAPRNVRRTVAEVALCGHACLGAATVPSATRLTVRSAVGSAVWLTVWSASGLAVGSAAWLTVGSATRLAVRLAVVALRTSAAAIAAVERVGETDCAGGVHWLSFWATVLGGVHRLLDQLGPLGFLLSTQLLELERLGITEEFVPRDLDGLAAEVRHRHGLDFKSELIV